MTEVYTPGAVPLSGQSVFGLRFEILPGMTRDSTTLFRLVLK